jgi:hypothetical protein
MGVGAKVEGNYFTWGWQRRNSHVCSDRHKIVPVADAERKSSECSRRRPDETTGWYCQFTLTLP